MKKSKFGHKQFLKRQNKGKINKTLSKKFMKYCKFCQISPKQALKYSVFFNIWKAISWQNGLYFGQTVSKKAKFVFGLFCSQTRSFSYLLFFSLCNKHASLTAKIRKLRKKVLWDRPILPNSSLFSDLHC